MPLTFVGALVSCSACGSIGHIVAQGPRWIDTVRGKEVALEGDLNHSQRLYSRKKIANDVGAEPTSQAVSLALLDKLRHQSFTQEVAVMPTSSSGETPEFRIAKLPIKPKSLKPKRH